MALTDTFIADHPPTRYPTRYPGRPALTVPASLLILLAVLMSCRSSEPRPDAPQGDLFTVLGADETGITFRNDLEETLYMNGLFYEYYYNGGGVAAGDFNNDGLPDIYFVSNLENNRLYLNRGELTFRDVTLEAGVAGQDGFPTGVTTVDINHDGWLDLYVCRSGKFADPDKRRNLLFVNQGANERGIPRFEEQAAAYGLDREELSTQAAFLDFDRDGDLDLFLLNHDVDTYRDDQMEAYLQQPGRLSGERFLINDGDRFRDATQEAGIVNNHLSYGLGLAVGDLNRDGWPDIYVGHDYAGADHLYINQGNGRFAERAETLLRHTSNFSMGADVGDINQDGWLDLITVDMVSEDNYGIKTSMSGMNPAAFYRVVDLGLHHQYMFNTLQLNRGLVHGQGPYFSEVAHLAGVSNTDWSWGPLFFDMDLDGKQDLFVSNGIKRDFRNNDFVNFHKAYREQLREADTLDEAAYIREVMERMPTRKRANYFFLNRDGLRFTQWQGSWADLPSSSNGAAYADFDGDGDLDIVVNNMDDPARIYRNHAADLGLGHFLKVKLEGSALNPMGIGARVEVETEQGFHTAEHYLSRGFQSAVAPGLHLGLGRAGSIRTLRVYWPDGRIQVLHDLPVDREISLRHTDADETTVRAQAIPTPFSPADLQDLGINYRHRENAFNDFERESLLPHRMSRFGPALAVGDVNGDGLEDLFLGGAFGQDAHLYLQEASGTFSPVQTEVMAALPDGEDMDAAFFDADGDGDNDLYIVRGGNERPAGDPAYQDLLLLNENGRFRWAEHALPPLPYSGSCVRAADWDADGDTDLFVGGRQQPGAYPFPGHSVLLRNLGGGNGQAFERVAEPWAESLAGIGMVTDARWSDLNQDGALDLLLVGEWMAPRVFEQHNGQFVDRSSAWGLDDQVGWWFGLEVGDVDQDGDPDLVAGNLGLNYKYQATTNAPFEVYAHDFDQNGDLDIVLGYHDDGNLFPLRGRECSSNQMPFIKEKFPTYNAFGQATLEEVYGADQLAEALHYRATTFASTYFENDGGRLHAHPLPDLAQLSSTNAILLDDFNGDSHLDALLAGNLYAAEVETPRNDAGYGMLLQGDGQGNFTEVPAVQSGLLVEGDVKHMKSLRTGNGHRLVIFAANNAEPRAFFLGKAKNL